MKRAMVNPFYLSRDQRRPAAVPCTFERSIYARIPLVPTNASPVPHLTSLCHFHRAGEYGDRSYPRNCGGNLIKNLLSYLRSGLVFNPMSGSGTCRDVCDEHGIPCIAWDIHQGYDAPDPASAPAAETFDFVWAHPAYWRMNLYADDPRDLSRAPTLGAFVARYRQFIRNAARALKVNRKLAILMGDYNDREAGFVPLLYHTKRLAFEAGLRQHCTDIIRFSHGASSGKKVFRSSFIPGLHDVCMIFERSRNQEGDLS